MKASNNTTCPSLDNRETTGGTAENPATARAAHNARRLRRTAFLRRENLRFAGALEEGFEERVKTAIFMNGDVGATQCRATHKQVHKLIGNLRACCGKAAFREFLNPTAFSFMGGLTCKNKLCQVCNSERKRKLRSKYMKYFEEHDEIREQTDAMHLVLTVPHNAAGGWRGRSMYCVELLAAFNALRKEKEWKRMVYAGELSVEFTRGKNGLHVHIHALVLAHHAMGSRNALHAWILAKWNRLTIDTLATRQAFTADQLVAIRAGLPAGERYDSLPGSLDPRGATHIGLESLYVTSDTEKPGYRHDPSTGRYKRYVKAPDPAEYTRGVLECLKYHFEPLCLKSGGGWDADAVFALAPLLYRKRLYSKFGAFYGVKELNIQDASLKEEIDAMLEAEGHDVVVHPESGEIAEREEYTYTCADAGKARVDDQGRIRLLGTRSHLPGSGLREAVMAMAEAAYMDKVRQRKEAMAAAGQSKANSFTNNIDKYGYD